MKGATMNERWRVERKQEERGELGQMLSEPLGS
jgi:hypothetical protein